MFRILIFAKAPVPGQAKTRLAPLLGSEGAADLAKRMLVETCREAAAVDGALVELCTTPAPSSPEWGGLIPPEVDVVSDQGGGDLGERLYRAAERALNAGDPVVLIGTDCPELDRIRISAARSALSANDAFLHPAADGGYVLLALKRNSPMLFAAIDWSSAKVTEQTIARLQELGWRYAVGDTLRDIDTPEDYEAWFGAPHQSGPHGAGCG